MNSFATGFAGLFLFIGNWFSSSGDGELTLREFTIKQNFTEVTYRMDFRWSDEATAIIDAGIPLIIKHSCSFENGHNLSFIRTLKTSVESNGYTVFDSKDGDKIKNNKYSNIYVALKRFRVVTISDSSQSAVVSIVTKTMPSPVSSLSRTVDLSPICGGEQLSSRFIAEVKR